MIQLLHSFYPGSILLMIFAFVFGFAMAGIFIGAFSLFIFFILLATGVIRVLPILDFLNQLFIQLFPSVANSLHTNVKEQFPIRFSSEKQEPQKKAIYMFHPHGVFSICHYLHIFTSLTLWKDYVREKVHACTFKGVFWVPVVSEVVEKCEAIPATYPAMKKKLDEGVSISVCPGGMREMLDAGKKELRINLLNRKGIFKMALETGAPLIPVLSYGENEAFDVVRWKWLEPFQKWLKEWDMCILIPSFSSLKKMVSILLGTSRETIETVIGDVVPIQEGDTIESLKKRYITSLETLYEKTRPTEYNKKIIFY